MTARQDKLDRFKFTRLKREARDNVAAGLVTAVPAAPPEGGPLLRYDRACQALAEARTIDEVKDWEDKAAAVREYARRAKNRELEIDAAEIRVRAQRRHGELLKEMKAAGMLAEGRKKLSPGDDSSSRVTLAELDTTLNESSRAQQLAAIAPDAFERLAARVRARLEKEPQSHAFDVLRERDGPINGARAVMGSRQEPDDSLDYFPTPPWATRALCERVLPALGVTGDLVHVWEPACGEGHMAEVLGEYSDLVTATDIHDYGYGGCRDFFAPVKPDGIDWALSKPDPYWIITNPPFGDKAVPFVLRALELASVGVAMFFRTQWVVEGIERYEKLFRDRPPTLLAFFVERVPLVKGRWDPDAATATAYCWAVWKRDAESRPPLWIAPDCRASLTRPTDRERFTQHPVAGGASVESGSESNQGRRPEPAARDRDRAHNAGASLPLAPTTLEPVQWTVEGMRKGCRASVSLTRDRDGYGGTYDCMFPSFGGVGPIGGPFKEYAEALVAALRALRSRLTAYLGESHRQKLAPTLRTGIAWIDAKAAEWGLSLTAGGANIDSNSDRSTGAVSPPRSETEPSDQRADVDGRLVSGTPEKVEATVETAMPSPSSEGGQIPSADGSLAPRAIPLEEILEHELEAAGPALAPVDTATSPDIAGEDGRRKAVMAGGLQAHSSAETKANGGGEHEVSPPTAANEADAGDVPTSADFALPSFLDRASPDCIVKAAR